MTDAYPLKNLPAPLQMLVRPMLLISLGLHGLLLFVPISSDKNPILAKKQEETVKITQLPNSPSKPVTSKPSPSRPRQTVRQAVPLNRPRAVVTPVPRTETRTETPQSNAASPQASPDGAAPPTSSSPFADFPQYPGAQPGYLGKQNLRQTGDEIKQVAAYFKKELAARKYIAAPETDEAAKKVYQVSKGGQTQYLSLFQVPEGTVYALGPEPLDKLEDLKGAVEVPDELYVFLGELGEDTADDTQLDEPSKFYARLSSDDDKSLIPGELRPEIEGDPKLVRGQSVESVYSTLQEKLQSNGFTVAPAGTYGGGTLYKMQKGNFTGYLNLVPNKDRSGTVVIVWIRLPT